LASWQAVLWLVPAGIEVTDPESAWAGIVVNQDVPRVLSYLLPQTDRHEDVTHFGDYESHDIALSMHASGVESIRVRVDMRRDDIMEFLHALWSVTQVLGAECASPDGGRMLPEPVIIAEHLGSTRAVLFLADPVKYFATITDQAV